MLCSTGLQVIGDRRRVADSVFQQVSHSADHRYDDGCWRSVTGDSVQFHPAFSTAKDRHEHHVQMNPLNCHPAEGHEVEKVGCYGSTNADALQSEIKALNPAHAYTTFSAQL